MTTQEQLDKINASIDAVLGGAQDYQIGSRRITRANIYHLFRERERLEKKLYNENNSDIVVAEFDRR